MVLALVIIIHRPFHMLFRVRHASSAGRRRWVWCRRRRVIITPKAGNSRGTVTEVISNNIHSSAAIIFLLQYRILLSILVAITLFYCHYILYCVRLLFSSSTFAIYLLINVFARYGVAAPIIYKHDATIQISGVIMHIARPQILNHLMIISESLVKGIDRKSLIIMR